MTGPVFNLRLPDHYLQPRNIHLSARHPHVAGHSTSSRMCPQLVLHSKFQAVPCSCCTIYPLTSCLPPPFPSPPISCLSFTSHIPPTSPPPSSPAAAPAQGPTMSHLEASILAGLPASPPTNPASTRLSDCLTHVSGPPLSCLKPSQGALCPQDKAQAPQPDQTLYPPPPCTLRSHGQQWEGDRLWPKTDLSF